MKDFIQTALLSVGLLMLIIAAVSFYYAMFGIVLVLAVVTTAKFIVKAKNLKDSSYDYTKY
jgi:hypothetical protein